MYKRQVTTYLTDPNDADSDDDGLSDGNEVTTYLTDPNDADSDNDGFTDGEEVDSGTDPLIFIDNWLSRGVLLFVILLSSITALIILYIVTRKKKIK